MSRRACPLLACLALSGCLAPVVPLEDDAGFWREAPPLAADLSPRLMLAPVSLSYREAGPYLYTSEELDRYLNQAQRPPAAEEAEEAGTPRASESALPYTWAEPPLEPVSLQERLLRLLDRTVFGTGETGVALLPPGDLKSGATRAARRQALFKAADDGRADVVIHLDIAAARVSWVERDVLPWCANFVALWGCAFVPALWIPDQVYEVSLTAQLTVHHIRSGTLLLHERLVGSQRHALNHPQRGWSLAGLFWLQPFFFDPGEADYGDAYETLLPHAREELLRRVLRTLRGLPARLSLPRNAALLEDGLPQLARSYALVVGANGPEESSLRHARRDADAVARALQDSGTLDSDHLVRLTRDPTSAQVLAGLERLGPNVRGCDDFLFYYAGYGTLDEEGQPCLLLADRPLPVRELAARCRAELRYAKRAVFVCDTAFSPRLGGRSLFPAPDLPELAPPQGAETSPYAPLADESRGWCVLAAAGPAQTASEIEVRHADESAGVAHGFFTHCLLLGLSGAADRDPRDERITTRELQAFVAQRVPELVRPRTGREQTPQLSGTKVPLFVARVPAQESK